MEFDIVQYFIASFISMCFSLVVALLAIKYDKHIKIKKIKKSFLIELTLNFRRIQEITNSLESYLDLFSDDEEVNSIEMLSLIYLHTYSFYELVHEGVLTELPHELQEKIIDIYHGIEHYNDVVRLIKQRKTSDLSILDYLLEDLSKYKDKIQQEIIPELIKYWKIKPA